MPLSQLKIGDMIQTQQDQYTQVYGFGHNDPHHEGDFIRIVYAYNDSFDVVNAITMDEEENDTNRMGMTQMIEISAEHLLFGKTQEPLGSLIQPVRAMDVRIGDELSGGHIVTAIEYVKRRGVYAPLTYSGDMMISGIHVSNYVQAFDDYSSRIMFRNQHDWAHMIFTPQRWFCSYFLEHCKKERYINGYGLIAYFVVGTSDVVLLTSYFMMSLVVIAMAMIFMVMKKYKYH
jgi:Hint module